MLVGITGITGNMGQATLEQVLKIEEIDKFKLLVLPDDKRINKLLRQYQNYKEKLEVVFGNLGKIEDCRELVKDCDYVVNLAAVIPPHSDQYPLKAVECNEVGVKNLVAAIEEQERQPKFIHISTVALYGNRNSRHLWARVGDPLLVSPFDIYAATKLRGEFAVLESNIKNFVVLRQSAMLHKNMLSDNMSDGLMFHTCYNAPLEWVSAHDSGVLIANILKKDMHEDLSKVFWRRVFNIGAGIKNCQTGYSTLNAGFKIIGGSVKDFFGTNFNATRNFHGVWFYDGDKLENLFHYQTQSTEDFWNEFAQNHEYFKLGKIVPKNLIKKLAIERLFKNPNSPAYWDSHNDEAKMQAYFGGEDNFKEIPSNWEDFPLLEENKDENGEAVDFEFLKNKENAKLLNLGFDIDSEKVTIDDLKNVAYAHGGKLLSQDFNDIYDTLTWQNADGQAFPARAYTILFAGHWVNKTYSENVWDFDRLSKIDRIYSQVWYDSHLKDEDKIYYFDKDFNARMKSI